LYRMRSASLGARWSTRTSTNEPYSEESRLHHLIFLYVHKSYVFSCKTVKIPLLYYPFHVSNLFRVVQG